MNRHYDCNYQDNADEFEKRLSMISLAAPSEQYQHLPDRLKSNKGLGGRGRRQWLAATAVLGVVAVFTLVSPDPNQPQPAPAGQAGTLPQNGDSARAAHMTAEQSFTEGTHYVLLRDPVNMSDSTTTQVVAFFWYPCRPCFEFEEYLTAWEAELDDDVTLTRVPAIWSPAMRFHARAYYTARALGVLDRAHLQLYTALRRDNPAVSNEEELERFFTDLGIPAAEFTAAYHSEAVLEQLRQAEQENFDYQIQSTPSMFIAGRYGISPGGAGGFREMLEVARFLIGRER